MRTLQTGFSPDSWRQAVDVLINKKPDNFLTNKLQVIMLFDAVTNLAFKLIGCTLMHQAERHKLLAPEQGGSRKAHVIMDLGLQKQLTFDVSCQLRHPLALCSNDAKDWYNMLQWYCTLFCDSEYETAWLSK